LPNQKVNDISFETLKTFDVAFVCTPNHLHIKQAVLCAKAGCHLFIEKPLSHNLEGVEELIEICKEKRLINMVACNMRFHKALQFIKENKQSIGRTLGIHLECGYYLPYWRKGKDYKRNYAAKKEFGGGIILDDIHEFDLLFWFNNFAPIIESKFIFGKVSDLEIETEDSCVAGFKFRNNVLGSVRCDYLQKPYSRAVKIIGELGNLEWDFNQNIVWSRNEQGAQKLFEDKNYDTNEMYVDQLKYFFNCLKTRQKTFNDIETAVKVLAPCLNK